MTAWEPTLGRRAADAEGATGRGSVMAFLGGTTRLGRLVKSTGGATCVTQVAFTRMP